MSITMEMPYCKRNPAVDAVLRKIGELHDRKNEDYTQDSNPYSNFEDVANITGLPVESVFRVLIGVKMARLKVLMKKSNKPNFESIKDTVLDMAVYSTIFASYEEKV